ncbi:MAG: single-stranded DNA-binding protein [Candidatus Jordarchaeum sp.]|uniref:single-stranded DNA-binding protein n=1 Tax=Candidatus Jordarchaeum sp. TaxID=2823881 RepID=UPI00404ACDCE
MAEAQDFIVESLRPGLKSINVKFKVESLNDEREVVSKKTGETLRVTEALVGDSTGSILITLWNEDIDKIKDGHTYKLNNGYTTVFKGSLRLNIGRYGNLEEIEESEDFEVNSENNLSEKVYEQERSFRPRYGGSGPRYGGSRPYRSDRRRERRY